MVVALALSVAGTARSDILDDYLATGERIGAIMDRLRASETYRAELEPYTDESRKPRLSTMTRVLEILDEQFGGPVAWLDFAGLRSCAAATPLGRFRFVTASRPRRSRQARPRRVVGSCAGGRA